MSSSVESVTPVSPLPPSLVRRLRGRWWFRLIVYGLLGYVAWCTALYFYQDHLVFPADHAPTPLKGLADARTVVSALELPGGGRVEAWFMPALSATSQHRTPVVVFLHGNAEIIDYQDYVVRAYQRMSLSVLLPEYRGYGRATGQPGEEGIVADMVYFYDQMITRNDVDRSRVVIHGRSLGGGVAAQLAARRKPAALILESTFTSVAAMAHKYWAPEFLATSPFRTDRAISAFDFPMLIFHGSQDTIIPVAHGRRLHELAPSATYVEYPCDHVEFPGRENETAYWKDIASFLSKAGVIQ